MLLNTDLVREVVNELIKEDREFHSTELAEALGKRIGMVIKVDTARYWANKFTLDGLLERRPINKKLRVYRRRKGIDLSSSLTVQKPSN